MVRSTSLGGGLSALHVLDSGRIVAAGTTVKSQTGDQFLVEKYKRDGTFDTSFGGGDGAAVTGFKTGGESRDDFGLDMAVQSDGKIVVAGESIGTDKRFAVVRYTSAGVLDPSFSGGGVLTSFAQDAAATGVAVNNGTHKILLVGDEITTARRSGSTPGSPRGTWGRSALPVPRPSGARESDGCARVRGRGRPPAAAP